MLKFEVELSQWGGPEAKPTEREKSGDPQKEAAKLFANQLLQMASCARHIQDKRLSNAIENLNLELKVLKSHTPEPPSTEDLMLANRLITILMYNSKINSGCLQVLSYPSQISENSSTPVYVQPAKPKNDVEFKAALKGIVKEMEIKGPRWGKILGAVLIIGGILLSIASFATLIPSFGTSAAAVPVAVTWTLAGLSFFSTSVGAGAEYLSRDKSTNLSAAVDQVIKAF